MHDAERRRAAFSATFSSGALVRLTGEVNMTVVMPPKSSLPVAVVYEATSASARDDNRKLRNMDESVFVRLIDLDAQDISDLKELHEWVSK